MSDHVSITRMMLKLFIGIAFLQTLNQGNLLIEAQEAHGRILSGPHDQSVAQGDIVYFNCHAQGTSVTWHVNGSVPYPQNTFEARGFHFTYITIIPYSQDQLGEKNNTITVVAQPAINNTRIKCIAYGQAHGPYDDVEVEATLRVIGPPLAPPYNLTQQYVGNGIVQHTLRWSIPFFWPGFPITHYIVTIQNFGNGDTITVIKSNTSLSHTHTTDDEYCYKMDFSLAANSAVGRGEETVTHAGNPIAPDEIENIETATFLLNETSYVQISFLAPTICPESQTGNYNIAIYDNADHLLKHLGPEVYTQENQENKTLIEKDLQVVLTQGEVYKVLVTSESIGASISNTTTFRSTVTQFQVSSATNVNDESDVTTTGILLPGSKIVTWTPATIAGIVLGSGVTVLCIIITAVISVACIWCCKKRKITSQPDGRFNIDNRLERHKTRPLNLKLQSNNPIYEGSGPVYEPMPEAMKHLLSPDSTPTTPQADAAVHYTFESDPVPSLPPLRKTSTSLPMNMKLEDEKVDLSLPQSELPSTGFGDEYMVMQKSFPKGTEIISSVDSANINPSDD